MSSRRVELGVKDVLVYKGMEIDRDVLDAIVSADKRLLWAFMKSECGTAIRAYPYSEECVIWLEPPDIPSEQDIEV